MALERVRELEHEHLERALGRDPGRGIRLAEDLQRQVQAALVLLPDEAPVIGVSVGHRASPGRLSEARGLFPALVYTSLATTAVATLGAPIVPVIAAEQGVSLATAQWSLTATLLVGAVAAPVLGRLADGRHRRQWLVATLAATTLGCAISALSTGFAAMLVGRALQGTAYGVLAMCLAAIREHGLPERLPSRVATLSVTGATGVGIGYALIGGIAELLGYRGAFWFGGAVAASAIVAVLFVLPARAAGSRAGNRLDAAGALLLALGVTALLLAVGQGQKWGWGSAPVWTLLAGAAVTLVVWVRHERRVARPLVELRLLRHRAVLLADVSAFLLGVTMFMGFSVITRLAQAPPPGRARRLGRGRRAAAGAAGAGRAALQPARARRGAPRRDGAVLPIGVAIDRRADLILAAFHDHAWQLALAMLIFGAGVGSTFAAMPALIVEGVPHDETGSAMSFNALLRSVGGASGSALSAVLLSAYTPLGAAFPTEHGYTVAFLATAALGVAVFAALISARPRRAALAPAAEEVTAPLV